MVPKALFDTTCLLSVHRTHSIATSRMFLLWIYATKEKKKKKEKRVISCRSLQVCNLGLSIGAYLYVNSLQMLTNAVFLSVIRMQIVRIPKAHFVVSV